jgi:hypothetical protein
MKFRSLLFTVALFFGNVCSYGQTIAGWQLFGALGNETTINASTLDSNLNPSTLIRLNGATSSSLGNAFSSSNYTTNGTQADAVANNKGFAFTINALGGFQASLSTLNARFRRSASGPNAFAWYYSLDGTTFIQIGAVILFTATTTNGVAQTQIDLSVIPALQNVASGTIITFRLLGWGATAATGTFAIGRSLTNGATDFSLAVGGTITQSAITSFQNGDWHTGSTWIGGIVPTSSENVIVNHKVTASTSIIRNAGTSTTINANSSLAVAAGYTNNGTTTVNGTFQLNAGGWADGTTNFVYSASNGTLVFNSAITTIYGVNNTDVYWPSSNAPFNVTVLQGGINLNAANRTVAGIFAMAGGVTLTSSTLTLNGTCQINSGGYFNNSPIYGAASLLQYNSGATYNRSNEWQALGVGTIGSTAGYPNNLQLSGNTTLNYNNGTPLAKAINGSLTIDAGSSLYMNYGGGASGGSLTVAGNVINNGNFTLGNAVNDDLKIGGNFSTTATGVFSGNNRAVIFTKVGTQTVSNLATTTLAIPYVVLSGGTTLQLNNDLIVTAPLGGTAISFTNSSDIFDISSKSITIGTAGTANTISGLGTFKGTTTSNMYLLGTGSIGTLNFTSGFQELSTLLMNRTATAVGCVLGTPVTINTSLTLTNGLVDLGTTTMTLATSCNNIFSASANSYVIADGTSGGVLRKGVTSIGTVNFPIGDSVSSADGSNYSPATLTFTAGSFASAYLSLSVYDLKHPSMDATTNFISRYWSVTSSGITSPTYTFGSNYLAVDGNGTETLSKSNQWNGLAWSNAGASIGGNALSIGSCTTLPTINHFSAGERDREINIVQGATTYLSGASTYNFGTVLTGATLDVVFTIQNLGQQTLTLAATPTLTGNPPYSLQANYGSVSVAGISGSTPGTQTFTIRFAPTTAGTLTGSVSIGNNDTSGSENPYIINFTGVGQTPVPEINIQAASGGLGNITSGNVTTTNGLQNTAFGIVTIGSITTKDFKIQNTGTAVLTLTGVPIVSIGGSNPGDFLVTTVPATNSIAAGGSTTFIITFTPQAVGVRSAIVSIANNDSDENPYTYLINGTGVCQPTSNTVTPNSGPVGTEITITATTYNLTGATVVIGGANATSVTYLSSSEIKVIVPSGAINGSVNIITTNSQGCQASTLFTVLANSTTSCQGGTNAPDLFISEVTDATFGGLTYIEIYNGTGASVNLTNYSLQFFANGVATSYGTAPFSGTLANGATYVVSTSTSTAECAITGGNGSLANQISTISGVNFSDGVTTSLGHDHIGLYKSGTLLDSWGIYMNQSWADLLGIGDRGVDFRRKNTVTIPSATYSNSDWEVIDWIGSGSASCPSNDYSNIGIYSFLAGNPPTVTTHPSYTPTCKATILTIAGTEGFLGGNPLTYQWYTVAPNSATWTAISDGGLYSGATTVSLAISDISTLIGYQYYCQVRENTATCYSASNAVKLTVGQSTTWQSAPLNTWSNGVPTINTAVTIDNNYDTANGYSPSFDACSLTINTGKTVTLRANTYANIQNDLTVSAGANLIVENNGSLVQINDNGVATGSIDVQRTALVRHQDYVYWSSPVAATLVSSLPTTNRYEWGTTSINSNGTQGNWIAPTTTTMTKGKGYIARASNGATTIQSLTKLFTGVPFNGLFAFPISRGTNVTSLNDNWNLIGNPYASAISAISFLQQNTGLLDPTPNLPDTTIEGAVRLWTHNLLPSNLVLNPFYQNFTLNYSPNDYVTFNQLGASCGGCFNGFIASGQGFFVVMKDGVAATQSVIFKNSMRNKNYSNSNFFKTTAQKSMELSDLDTHRIWLDLIDATGVPIRMLIGYAPGATLEKDNMFDAYTKIGTSQNFYSLINDDIVTIQGRPAPFDNTDVVPLGIKVNTSGNYTIAINAVDGLFENTNQNIYLEDTTLNIIHDLRQAPYEFTAVAGRFDTRFKLRYTNTGFLGTGDLETLNNSVVVSTPSNKQIAVQSTVENMKSVVVYDVLGRIVYNNNNINASQLHIDNLVVNQQALIVKITLENGLVVTRKIVF